MNSRSANRRTFLKTAAAAGPLASASAGAASSRSDPDSHPVSYPRRFSGRQLQMLAFPLGGVAAGSISLGGRGQLRDWEIFNQADKGRSPNYAFPSIWVRAGNAKPPVAKVLEARLQPPYQAAEGLGPGNAPGLQRFASAEFQGEYPLARIEFQDSAVPVKVELEAFTPIIPLDAEESGLPVAVLRYKVTNPGPAKASVSIAFSIDSPVGGDQKRVNEVRTGSALQGIYMHAPELDVKDPMKGSFALAVVDTGVAGRLSMVRGWAKAKWWASPLLFWDDFSLDGELDPGRVSGTWLGPCV